MLKINPITNINIKKTILKKPEKPSDLKSRNSSFELNDFNKYLISFGSTIKEKAIFLEESIKHAQSICEEKGSQGLVEYIKNKNFVIHQPRRFFNQILENKETAYHLIKAMTGNFEKTPERIEIIEKKLGQPLYLLENYEKGFEHFQKRFIKESTIEELLEYRPDWTSNVFKRNLSEFNKMELGDYKDFFKSKKELEEFLRNLKLSLGKPLDYKNKYNKSFNLNGKTYKYKEYSEGRSYKSIYEVTNGEKTFIVKIEDFGKKDEDSVFQNACFDYYLTQNGSKNTPKLYYFNNIEDTAFYEMIEGEKIYETTQSDLYETNKSLKAFDVRSNDLSGKNNIIIQNDGTWKLIDIGYSYFNNFYKPKIKGMNIID